MRGRSLLKCGLAQGHSGIPWLSHSPAHDLGPIVTGWTTEQDVCLRWRQAFYLAAQEKGEKGRHPGLLCFSV